MTEAFVFAVRPILEISLLFVEGIQHGLRCIAFGKTCKLSELVLSNIAHGLRCIAKVCDEYLI